MYMCVRFVGWLDHLNLIEFNHFSEMLNFSKIATEKRREREKKKNSLIGNESSQSWAFSL